MSEIGAYQAKTKLPELLRQVQKGKRFTITRHGEPIAELVPSGSTASIDANAAIDEMLKLERVRGVSADDVATWIAEGRH